MQQKCSHVQPSRFGGASRAACIGIISFNGRIVHFRLKNHRRIDHSLAKNLDLYIKLTPRCAPPNERSTWSPQNHQLSTEGSSILDVKNAPPRCRRGHRGTPGGAACRGPPSRPPGRRRCGRTQSVRRDAGGRVVVRRARRFSIDDFLLAFSFFHWFSVGFPFKHREIELKHDDCVLTARAARSLRLGGRRGRRGAVA